MRVHKMSEDDLLNAIEHQERQAVGYYTGHVANEQAKALNYYLSKPFGTEEEGRSSVVSSDVWDVVEGLTPIVLKPFVASDDVVRFNALGPDDEDAAQQETDYINWVVTAKNDVFNELVAAVKTGLLQKNAVAKYWWEKSRKTTIERYFGISDDEFAMIGQADGVEVIEHTETQGQPQIDPHTGQQMPPETMHDVTLRTVDEVGEARYEVLPPEEFLVGRNCTTPNPKTADFVQHRKKVTISALREMGYEVDDDLTDGGEDPQFSLQYQARRWDEEAASLGDSLDPTTRLVLYKETTILADFDGDGIAELRKVCSVGRHVFSNEETEEINFVAWTPYPQPFKFYGRCPADETAEIQLIKSTLWRQTLDNIYTINNNRVYVSSKVNLDDLLDNQIAGIVRVDGDAVAGHVMPGEIAPIGQVVQPMIEYLDSAKENRTGFTRYNQGTDANTLNKTATGVRIIKEAGDSRTELIARAFAEQFLAPLMLGIHGLCRRHATKAETIQLRGEWVKVDPREWKKRSNLSVSVGLGTADQQMKMQGAQLLFGAQMQLAQSPFAPLVQPQNIYNSVAKLVQALGYKQPEQFWTHPDKAPPPQPHPPDPAVMKIQADHDIKTKELALEAQKVKILQNDSIINAQHAHATLGSGSHQEGARAYFEQQAQEKDRVHQAQIEMLKAQNAQQSSAMQDARERDKMAHEAAMAERQLQFEDKWKELDARVKLDIAQTAATAAADAATTKANDAAAARIT